MGTGRSALDPLLAVSAGMSLVGGTLLPTERGCLCRR